MKVKKYLEKQAEKDRRAIMTEGDEKFLQETMARIDGAASPAPRSSSKLKSWLTGAMAFAVMIACVLVFCPLGQDAVYLESNFVKNDSTIEAMDIDMKEFAFNISEPLYSAKVEKITDSVTGDTIMYQANITSADTYVKMTMIAICNKNYHYNGIQVTESFISEKLPLYNVSYLANMIPDPVFHLDQYSVIAQIRKGKEYVYLTNYVETVFDGQPRFLDLVQALIK